MKWNYAAKSIQLKNACEGLNFTSDRGLIRFYNGTMENICNLVSFGNLSASFKRWAFNTEIISFVLKSWALFKY